MALGIGVDMVTISEIARFLPEGGLNAAAVPAPNGPSAPSGHPVLHAFIRRTFTPSELAQAAARHDQASYLAGRFAVKEAVFKALAPRTSAGFDLRVVETLDDETGAPRVTTTGPLAPVLAEARATEALVSITNEGDFAVAFALVQ